MSTTWRSRAGMLLLVLASRRVLHAAPGDPVGPELQVNTYTTSSQGSPAAAPDGAGGFVVVWDSDGSSGTDTSQTSVQAQRFDSTGAPLGAEFQVNAYTTSVQGLSSVAPLAPSGFVVAWSGVGDGTDVSSGIWARRFDATGTPLAPEFQVNTYTTSVRSAPAVAAVGGGGFVVVWQSYGGSNATDTSGWGVFGQRFGADGSPMGGEFQVNTYTTAFQRYAEVSPLDDGGFIVVWESDGSSGTDTSGFSVQGQRFDGTGVAAGGEFQVNTYATSGQYFPGVGSDGAGGFVVVWGSNGSAGTDTSGYSAQARRFDGGGVPLGAEFQVNTYTTGRQYAYDVGPDGTGGFVVVWTSAGSVDGDTSEDSVQARRFDATGMPVGGELQVNTYTTGFQNNPRVEPDGAGGFVIVWRSVGSAGTDTSGNSVHAQRFEGIASPTTTTVPGASTSTTTPDTGSTTTSTLQPQGLPLRGSRLDLGTKPGRPEKSNLKMVSRDRSVTLGRGNNSADDPVAKGGGLTISSDAGGFDVAHGLVGSWSYVGKAGQNKGYRWKSRGAPIRAIVIRNGKLVKAVGKGGALGFDLDEDPNPVRIDLAIGGHTYCMEFGGERRFKATRLYRAERAAAPANCP